jgi:hypothetical protein
MIRANARSSCAFLPKFFLWVAAVFRETLVRFGRQLGVDVNVAGRDCHLARPHAKAGLLDADLVISRSNAN